MRRENIRHGASKTKQSEKRGMQKMRKNWAPCQNMQSKDNRNHDKHNKKPIRTIERRKNKRDTSTEPWSNSEDECTDELEVLQIDKMNRKVNPL